MIYLLCAVVGVMVGAFIGYGAALEDPCERCGVKPADRYLKDRPKAPRRGAV